MNTLHYISKLERILACCFVRNKIIDNDPMIFPCGVSRSGTTLLSAMLDAHSSICMGYEMLFPPIHNVDFVTSILESIRPHARNLRQAGSILRRRGLKDLGKWVSRCHRVGIDFDDLLSALDKHKKANGKALISLRSRVVLIKRILDISKIRQKTSITGFKIADGSFESYLSFFPNSYFVFILRDPRDVYSSLKGRGFDVTLESACNNWNKAISGFEKFQAKHPAKSYLLKYEDLVKDPRKEIESLFKKLDLALEKQVFDFHDSKASVLTSSHPNAPLLRQGFFTYSVDRFHKDLPLEDAETVARHCRSWMEKYGYTKEGGDLSEQPLSQDGYPAGCYSLSKEDIEKHDCLFLSRKVYTPEDYQNILRPYQVNGYEVLRLVDFVQQEEIGDRKILVLRHDIDHDYRTALQMAEWEHEEGLQSTYCVLHTAWYYGRLNDGHYTHTRDLVDCVRKLTDLGHEVIFHNNLAVLALRENIDPASLLRQELEFFASIGIPIKGTSTHGDSLCHELNFRSYELFQETCDGRYGGPRTVLYEDRGKRSTVTLGKMSMHDFGLIYEAYEIYWDVYHTDSGGKLQIKTNRHGMRHFGRRDRTRGSLVGVLTHPVWWRF